MRQRYHGNTDDESHAAQNHQRFAAHPIGQQACEQRGNDAAQQYSRDNDGKLAGVQAGCCFEIWKRAPDNADIHPVEQATQARDELQKPVVGNSFLKHIDTVGVPHQVLITVSQDARRACASFCWFPK